MAMTAFSNGACALLKTAGAATASLSPPPEALVKGVGLGCLSLSAVVAERKLNGAFPPFGSLGFGKKGTVTGIYCQPLALPLMVSPVTKASSVLSKIGAYSWAAKINIIHKGLCLSGVSCTYLQTNWSVQRLLVWE